MKFEEKSWGNIKSILPQLFSSNLNDLNQSHLGAFEVERVYIHKPLLGGSLVASIISFCTNEARFIRTCIEQCRIFSRQIIIPVCNRFFDGTRENQTLLESIYSSFPDVLFVEYPYLSGCAPSFLPSLSRWVAFQYVKPEIERILFIDADEIPEGTRVLRWLETSDWAQHSVIKLANYWYFREARFRAQSIEDSIIFVQKTALEPGILLHEKERDAIYELLPGPKKRNVTGCDGLPLFHHYSWVRTEQEMVKKVNSWGHRGDRDWIPLVTREFSAPFKGKDFVHGYTYEEVVPPFQFPIEDRFSMTSVTKKNVIRCCWRNFFKMLGCRGVWEWFRMRFLRLSRST